MVEVEEVSKLCGSGGKQLIGGRGGRLVGHFRTDVDTRNPFVEVY